MKVGEIVQRARASRLSKKASFEAAFEKRAGIYVSLMSLLRCPHRLLLVSCTGVRLSNQHQRPVRNQASQ